MKYWGLDYVSVVVGEGEAPRHPTWYELLVVPGLREWRTITAALAFWFLSLFFLGWLMPKISSQYRKLSLNQQKDMDVRTISIVHGIFTCFEIPMFIYASKEQAADLYGYSSTISQTVIAFSLGYFIFDLIVSYRYEMGTAFVIHAICCIFVCYFALYPFLHYYAGYFFGFFEISTIFNHIRGNLEFLGYTNTVPHLIASGLFALTYTLIRVIGGTYYSIEWLQILFHNISTGEAHSVFVYWYYAISNTILMLLQYYWFTLIVRAIVDLVAPANSTKKEKEQHSKDLKKVE